MTIFRKQVLLSFIFSFTIITSMLFFMWSGRRLLQIYSTMNEGLQLQVQSKEIMSLMKDIVFDLFSPQEYGQLRNLTYAPRSIVTIRQWKTSVDLYKQRFWLFMNSPGLRSIRSLDLAEQRDTAIVLNSRAMAKLSHMEILLEKLRILAYEYPGRLYSQMQKDAELIPFFSEFQGTSYYFTNSFESFMSHFQSSLQAIGEELVKKTYITVLSLIIFLGIISIVTALFIAKDIIYKLTYMEKTFIDISKGNFSIRMDISGNDEFGKLSARINELVSTLHGNIDSILKLTNDLGGSISEKMELKDIFNLITKGIMDDTTADGAAVFVQNENTSGFTAGAVEGIFPEQYFEAYDFNSFKLDNKLKGTSRRILHIKTENFKGNVIILPLAIHKVVSGFLIVTRVVESGEFTDLGIVRLQTFCEYVSLVLENYFRYLEILEKQDAEYLALQAQVQPHFLYNVLSSFMGLNRMGDSRGLEDAITALRDMLRYLQNRSRETTVGEELELIEKYLELQKIRFQERLRYNISSEKRVLSVRIPRLLVQPFVENAILHGLETLDKGGEISVTIKMHKEHNDYHVLKIEIYNTGDTLHKDYSSKRGGIGISNVANRLRIAYPLASFSITTPERGGTLVSIVIPRPKGLDK